MIKIGIKIIIAIFCITGEINSQSNIAYFETNYNFIDTSNTYYFEINGVDVSENDRLFSIPINKIGFDTIKFGSKAIYTSWAIMKLKQDTYYQIMSNRCSFYTIMPKKDPKHGMVHFRINSKDTTNYLVSVDGLSQRKLNCNIIDEFYFTPPSANCFYSSKSIEIQTNDEMKLRSIQFHFLHGELLGVEYDAKYNTIELNLFGHIRSEKDYRYLYSIDPVE